mmetsp:Transcript_4725/g.11923  ORF Transcript_4725/g.11923 Transcript_4725/m.11923 type:complete len:249 (+) Transcript_4725:928-1674(+)
MARQAHCVAVAPVAGHRRHERGPVGHVAEEAMNEDGGMVAAAQSGPLDLGAGAGGPGLGVEPVQRHEGLVNGAHALEGAVSAVVKHVLAPQRGQGRIPLQLHRVVQRVNGQRVPVLVRSKASVVEVNSALARLVGVPVNCPKAVKDRLHSSNSGAVDGIRVAGQLRQTVQTDAAFKGCAHNRLHAEIGANIYDRSEYLNASQHGRLQDNGANGSFKQLQDPRHFAGDAVHRGTFHRIAQALVDGDLHW